MYGCGVGTRTEFINENMHSLAEKITRKKMDKEVMVVAWRASSHKTIYV